MLDNLNPDVILASGQYVGGLKAPGVAEEKLLLIQFGRKGWGDDENIGPTIEDGAMIAVRAILVPRVVIGKGANTGSGDMINANVNPVALVGAMPARALPREWHEQ